MIYCNYNVVPVLLRTYYSSDPGQRLVDEKIEQWANAAEMLGDHIDWACLNDEQFNFGSNWQRVYEIMPEVAGTTAPRKTEPSELALFQFKESLRERKQWDYDEWKKNPRKFIENAATGLQHSVTTEYLLIANEEAFQSNHLRLLYVDHRMNIIRESRVEADGVWITDVIMDWDQMGLAPEFWEQGIGEKYRVDGELGPPFYQLTEEDWADSESHEVEAAWKKWF